MSDQLLDHVRRVMALDQTRAAALGDSRTKQVLFKRIIDTPMPSERRPIKGMPSGKRPRRRWVLVISVGVATAAAAVAALTVILDGQPSRETGSPLERHRGDVFAGAAVAGSCVELYTPQTLSRRSFAFDGTVIGLGGADTDADLYIPVTFKVHQWFRAGQGESITVKLLRPDGGVNMDATYGIGSRLLVSGEPRFGGAPLRDPVAWACGFTRWYDDGEAEVWRRTFG